MKIRYIFLTITIFFLYSCGDNNPVANDKIDGFSQIGIEINNIVIIHHFYKATRTFDTEKARYYMIFERKNDTIEKSLNFVINLSQISDSAANNSFYYNWPNTSVDNALLKFDIDIKNLKINNFRLTNYEHIYESRWSGNQGSIQEGFINLNFSNATYNKNSEKQLVVEQNKSDIIKNLIAINELIKEHNQYTMNLYDDTEIRNEYLTTSDSSTLKIIFTPK